MKNNLLVFGTKNLNNSLNEIKEYLDFTLFFFENNTFFNDQIFIVSALLVDSEVCNDFKNLSLINSITDKPILLIEKPGIINKCNYTDKINLPLTLLDLNSRIVNFITSAKFKKNSYLKKKKYIIDKNEKKLKKKNLSISVTEKEITLIELLFNEKKPLSKNFLLKEIWKYSEDADTHTVETHIYRLRKKILKTFNDENFIINSKDGYFV